jgi:hypothetical protein
MDCLTMCVVVHVQMLLRAVSEGLPPIRAMLDETQHVLGEPIRTRINDILAACGSEAHRVLDPLWYSSRFCAIREARRGSYFVSSGRATTRHLVNGNCDMYGGFRDAVIHEIRRAWRYQFDRGFTLIFEQFRNLIVDRFIKFTTAVQDSKELKDCCTRAGIQLDPTLFEVPSNLVAAFRVRFQDILTHARQPGSLESAVLKATQDAFQSSFDGAGSASEFASNLSRRKTFIAQTLQRHMHRFMHALSVLLRREVDQAMETILAASVRPFSHSIRRLLTDRTLTPTVDRRALFEHVARLSEVKNISDLVRVLDVWSTPPPVIELCCICHVEPARCYLVGCRCRQSAVSAKYCTECPDMLQLHNHPCAICRSPFTGFVDTSLPAPTPTPAPVPTPDGTPRGTRIYRILPFVPSHSA